MKRQCDDYEDIIWERARDESELPVEVARHVESCAECASALREARAMARSVVAVGDVREAPDCREAVMARLSRPQGRLIPVWGYACGIVAVAAMVVGGIAFQRVGQFGGARQAANRSIATATPEAHGNVRKLVPAPQKKVAAKPARKRSPHRLAAKRYFAKYARGAMAERDPGPMEVELPPSVRHVPPSVPSSAAPRSLSKDPTPVPRAMAAVAVTWPVAGDPPSASYSYVERDPQTGETTKCSVKRSGDKVEIYIESTPDGYDTPPVKGSIDDENKINA